jgi:hypothetical protein
MTHEDLVELEKHVMELVVKRRGLGGFDVNAGAILIMSEWLLEIVRHLREQEKPVKKK